MSLAPVLGASDGAVVPYDPRSGTVSEMNQKEDQLPPSTTRQQDGTLNDLDAEEVGKVVIQLQEEIQIIKLQLENLPGYDKGEVPEHLTNLKQELEKTFASLERKNEMLINAMTKNFGKTHQDLPNFRLPAIQNTSKKQALFALPHEPEAVGDIMGPDGLLRAKGAGILRPTASNQNKKTAPYKAKKSLGPIMKQRHLRDARHRMYLEEQEDLQNPPPISEDQINKGMINLLERGIIPKDVDLTPAFEKGAPPVQFKGMRFHEKVEQYAKHDVHTEKFNKNTIKFDMQFATAKMAGQPMGGSRALVPYQGTESGSGGFGESTLLPALEDAKRPLAIKATAGTQSITTAGREDHSKELTHTKAKDARGYNELMDEYSLHQLMFRKAKLIDETPEFVSFRRTHIDKWGPISFIIMTFENLFKEYNVNLAYVDGRKLVDLARESLDRPTKEEMFDCINNKEDVGKLVKIPTIMFKGPDGPIKAATVISKNFKMFKARDSYRNLLFLMKKATKIQRRFRLYLFQKQTKDRVEELTNESLFVWREMMDEFKQRWPAISQRRRVEVHINSLSISELQRISMEKFLQRENAQLSRIFAMKDPNVDVIYVSPFQMTSDVLGYYLKILEIGDINGTQGRLHFIVPDNINKFPHHFSLAQVLMYSPASMKRIKNIIQGKQAYIVPGQPSTDDIKLSIRLAIPIMCGEPAKQHLYSTKSGAKKIFQLADVPTPICQVDIYDEQEFLHSLSQLIAKNLYVTTWVFKIDDEFNGRGHASLNVDGVKPLQALKRKQLEPGIDIVEQIKAILIKYLPKKATLAMPSLFKSWPEYMAAFCRVGGIIEAAPTCLSHQMAAPSISFIVEPDGQTRIIGSMDKFQARSNVNTGCFFPQKSLPNMNMMTICKSIGDILYEKGVFGHCTVDLVAFPDPTTQGLSSAAAANAHPLFWAVDLNCSMTDYASACYFFDFLMEGNIDQLTGKYTINDGMNGKSQMNRSGYKTAESTNDGSALGEDDALGGSMSHEGDEDEEGRSQMSGNTRTPQKTGRSMGLQPSTRKKPKVKLGTTGVGGLNQGSIQHRRDFSEERSFMYCKYLHHPGLSKIQYKQFFHMCRLQSIAFDLESRKGTAFMLSDCLQSGVLSMMTIALDRRETLSMMCDAFKFLEQQAGCIGDLKDPGNMLDESRSDEVKIVDVVSAIRLLDRLQSKKEEKMKQMRYGSSALM